jgi:NhaA family Na+:H+ antiporter
MSSSNSTNTRFRNQLDRPIDPIKDHILGDPQSEMILVEYGSYASLSCQEAHFIITNLKDHFGDQLCYVFRHKPLANNEVAKKAAILAEYATIVKGDFWGIHKELIEKGTSLDMESLNHIAARHDLSEFDQINSSTLSISQQYVYDNIKSARKSGALFIPSFFINSKRYEKPWDENSLSEALIGSLSNKLQTITTDFVRWGASTGIVLLLMSLLAIIIVNSQLGPKFQAFWDVPFSFAINNNEFSLSLLEWTNNGLLTIFFLVVGLEIKREFTSGRLSNRRAATLPIAASIGGVIAPALLYIIIAPAGPLSYGWSTTISTDTAFAITILTMLGDRIPVRLRIFLTATAIVDDLISIIVVTLFYSINLEIGYLLISGLLILMLWAFNKANFYHLFPYTTLGILLWFCLHEGGIHPTVSGVILAFSIPTKPQTSFRALNVQAQTFFQTAARFAANKLTRKRPSQNALRILDNIHDRMESPADKMLHSLTPWSSYLVLPIFALANAGVPLVFDLNEGDLQLMLAIFIGLVIGKPIGIFIGAWLADRSKFADKPSAYTWNQLFGSSILAGMGFTMSLFFAGRTFPNPQDFSAAKIAIFLASFTAGIVGTYVLYRNSKPRHS